MTDPTYLRVFYCPDPLFDERVLMGVLVQDQADVTFVFRPPPHAVCLGPEREGQLHLRCFLALCRSIADLMPMVGTLQDAAAPVQRLAPSIHLSDIIRRVPASAGDGAAWMQRALDRKFDHHIAPIAPRGNLLERAGLACFEVGARALDLAGFSHQVSTHDTGAGGCDGEPRHELHTYRFIRYERPAR